MATVEAVTQFLKDYDDGYSLLVDEFAGHTALCIDNGQPADSCPAICLTCEDDACPVFVEDNPTATFGGDDLFSALRDTGLLDKLKPSELDDAYHIIMRFVGR